VKYVFQSNPLYVVMLGGASLLIAAMLVSIVEDTGQAVAIAGGGGH